MCLPCIAFQRIQTKNLYTGVRIIKGKIILTIILNNQYNHYDCADLIDCDMLKILSS